MQSLEEFEIVSSPGMKNLKKTDPQIYELVKQEEKRQHDVLEMIPSENYASEAVIETLGTVLTNKYSEGYPGRRYYQGNAVADSVESLAQDRAKNYLVSRMSMSSRFPVLLPIPQSISQRLSREKP